ncbi:MAG: permease [Siculibacillus sp.]|nr:permease [Siculibacillus sp.]
MNMTHYMELLAVDQPWNLLIYMAVPVVLAETVAISELYLLHTRIYEGPVRTLNRAASILGGIWFTGIFVHLMINAVVPLTTGGGWRGPADVTAVLSYLAGIVPLGGIALIDLGVIAKGRDEHAKMGLHAALVGVFLVVAHIAMIFGMMDPTILMSGTPGPIGGHMGH